MRRSARNPKPSSKGQIYANAIKEKSKLKSQKTIPGSDDDDWEDTTSVKSDATGITVRSMGKSHTDPNKSQAKKDPNDIDWLLAQMQMGDFNNNNDHKADPVVSLPSPATKGSHGAMKSTQREAMGPQGESRATARICGHPGPIIY